MKQLRELDFAEIHINFDSNAATPIAYMKGGSGMPPVYRVPIAEIKQDYDSFKELLATQAPAPEDGYTILAYEGQNYRISAEQGVDGRWITARRLGDAMSGDFESAGIPKVLRPVIGNGCARPGLFLVCGTDGVESRRIASVVYLEWLRAHGGVGHALQFPPEAQFTGAVGEAGWSHQPAINQEQDVVPAMQSAVRSDSRFMLFGTIESDDQLHELLNVHYAGVTAVACVAVETILACQKFVLKVLGDEQRQRQAAAAITGILSRRRNSAGQAVYDACFINNDRARIAFMTDDDAHLMTINREQLNAFKEGREIEFS